MKLNNLKNLRVNTKVDIISSPHPLSQIRLVRYAKKNNETELDKRLREKKEQLQAFVHHFWCENNLDYINRKKRFEEEVLKSKDKVEANDLTQFYKSFLNLSGSKHAAFHKQYIVKSFELLAFESYVFLSNKMFVNNSNPFFVASKYSR